MLVTGRRGTCVAGILCCGLVAGPLVMTGCLDFSGLTGGKGDGGEAGPPETGPGKEAGNDAGKDVGATETGDGGSGVDCGTFALPPASSLHWDFKGDPKADWITPAACATEEDGGLVAAPEGAGDYCLYINRASYHLTCDSITVKVPEATHQHLGVQTVIYIYDNASDAGSTNLVLENGGFQLGHGTSSNDLGPYDPVNDVWWKISESQGSLIFATSKDGTTWNPRSSIVEPTPVDNVSIALGAGEYMAIPDAGQAVFRCYNEPSSSCQ